MNQTPIFLLALPQKGKHSKVNQIQAPADTASGNSPMVSVVSPLQPTGHPIRELPVVMAGNTLEMIFILILHMSGHPRRANTVPITRSNTQGGRGVADTILLFGNTASKARENLNGSARRACPLVWTGL